MRNWINLIEGDHTPPEFEADDKDHYLALEKTGFFGAQGAGCVAMAKSTGRILIVLRSSAVLQPHTWSGCGGAYKIKEETALQAAKRELHEETGYSGNSTMIPLYIFTSGSFRYANFLAIVEDEFLPDLGWEADDYRWATLNDLPQPLHFGLAALFGDTKSKAVITHYETMFGGNDHA